MPLSINASPAIRAANRAIISDFCAGLLQTLHPVYQKVEQGLAREGIGQNIQQRVGPPFRAEARSGGCRFIGVVRVLLLFHQPILPPIYQ